mgnify:CR=1 FL=1
MTDILQSQIWHYETNQETNECKCSDSILQSAMLGVNVPCSHLIHMNVEFSSIEPPEIQLQNEFQSELIYEFKIHKSKKIVTDSNYYSRIRNSTVNTIQRFSHYKNKSEIVNYVCNKLPFSKTPRSFVFGYPTEAIHIIDEGIRVFSKEIKEENDKLVTKS